MSVEEWLVRFSRLGCAMPDASPEDHGTREVPHQGETDGKGAGRLPRVPARALGVELRGLLSSVPDAMLVTRLDTGQIVDINDAGLGLLGLRREETLGHTPAALGMGWVDLADRERFCRQLCEHGHIVAMETDFRHRSGAIRTGMLSSELIQYQDEPCVLTMIRDISESREAVRNLENSRKTLSLVLDHSSDALAVVRVEADGTLVIERVNRTCLATAGPGSERISEAMVVGREIREAFAGILQLPGEYVEACLALYQVAIQTQRPVRADLPLETVAGRVVQEVVLAPIVSGDGRVTHVMFSGRDVTVRIEREEAIAQNERKYRALFSEMVSGSALMRLAYDAAGDTVDLVFVEVNPAFERLTGLSSREVVGNRFSEHLAGGDRSWIDTLAQVGRTRHPVHLEKHSRQLNRWFEMTAYCPAPNQVACTFLDVTGRRRMDQEVMQARIELERANQAKDRFLATLSHELRTPLTPVLAVICSLQSDGRLPEDVMSDVQMMRRNIELEARLIDDLLDLTRIARGKFTLERQSVDTHELMRHVIANVQPVLDDRGLRVELRLEAKRHRVCGDPARLQQVFGNIVKNAMEHTSAGGRLVISTGATPEGRIEIAFSDDGEGIAAEHLGRVFDAFEQGPHRPGSRHGMLGLGLTICRSIVEMHGGAISVSSGGLGYGSTFAITLPVTDTQQEPRRADAGAAPGEHSRALRILLVEDHPASREVLARLLERIGHRVTAVGTRTHAVEVARSSTFDLLISDIGLPDGTGLDVISQMRRGPEMKAIALSGYGMTQDRERSRSAGFDVHLIKPVTPADLDEAIVSLFSNVVSGF